MSAVRMGCTFGFVERTVPSILRPIHGDMPLGLLRNNA